NPAQAAVEIGARQVGGTPIGAIVAVHELRVGCRRRWRFGITCAVVDGLLEASRVLETVFEHEGRSGFVASHHDQLELGVSGNDDRHLLLVCADADHVSRLTGLHGILAWRVVSISIGAIIPYAWTVVA